MASTGVRDEAGKSEEEDEFEDIGRERPGVRRYCA
jgi:hypothetical protein